jgi:hypothetical protein
MRVNAPVRKYRKLSAIRKICIFNHPAASLLWAVGVHLARSRESEAHMDLKHYVPISIGIFAAFIAATRYLGVPFAPFAFILLVGETIIGLQLEDQKVSRFLENLASAVKCRPHHVNRPHQ